MDTVLYFGKTGWIGGMLYSLLEFQKTIIPTVRLEDHTNLLIYLGSLSGENITHCVIAAGLTGVPNIDWCEDHKREVIDVNIIGTYLLGKWCDENDVHLTFLGTGCVYSYDTFHTSNNQIGFTEESIPNFGKTHYSKTKIIIQDILGLLSNTLILRIRMPVSDDFHEKNLVVKLSKYRKVVNVPNSVTVLPELLPLIPDMMRNKITGTYNFTNPGIISHNEILEFYKKHVDPSFTYCNFSQEEQDSIVNQRAHNCLNCGKLMDIYPEIGDVKISTEKAIMRMGQNKHSRK